jgi:hypothetical protein
MIRTNRTREAMERLAGSSWGKQGIGACPNRRVRQRLIESGFAKPVNGEPDRILSLTLKGFREVEKLRWDDRIRGSRLRGKAR